VSEPQVRFEARHAADWSTLEADLERLEARRPLDDVDFPSRYRRACQHLALARSRMYSPALLDRLNTIAVRGHQQLYGRRPVAPWLLRGIRRTFPAAVRAEWRLVLLAAILFYGTFAATFAAVQADPAFVHSVIDAESLVNMESMYDPGSERFLREREADSDVLMFGFYVRNNTGIGLRTFAGGLAAGLGTLFFLVFNGLSMGAVFGHLHHIGYGSTLYPFVIAHGAFELNAILLSGVAGLRLGWAVLAPGRRRRSDAIAHAARRALPIVLGMAAMFIIAAFIEAFWSPRHTIPETIRYSVGAVLWVLVGGYFLLAGRGRGGPDAP
jgi:uncharacterized membrane protein SpoIIM required for sporulation